MASKSVNVFFSILAACTIAIWAGETHAQTISPEKIEAGQKLYDEAVALMEQNNFSEACPKLEEVIRLVPEGVGAKLELAKCYEGAGRLASAWKAYKIAEAAAAVAGQPERHVRAKERATAIEPNLSSLTIVIADPVRSLPGFKVTRNGTVVDTTDLGTPIPVDGGTYRIEVTATGKVRSEKIVEIGPSGMRERVEVAKLIDSSAPPIVVPPVPQQTWRKPVGFGAIGVGAAGVLVGAVLGGVAVSKYDESKANGRCDSQNRCDQTGLDIRQSAIGTANASTALFVVGGVFLAAGGIVLATAPKADGSTSPTSDGKTAWRTRLEVGPSGFLIRGRW